MTALTIERDIEIDAPIEVVWRTITEPAQICRWFSDLADIEARPGAEGSLTFRAGGDDPHVVGLTVVDVDPPHRFSYRWVHPPGERATEANSTLVTFTLAAGGAERTLLTVAETGLDRMDLTEDEKEEFLEEHREGWQVQGDRLRDLFVSGPAVVDVSPTSDDDLWEAMTDPTRRKLLDLLVAHGRATATTLTTEMPVSRQAVSKHLQVLQRVGLIDGRREGREVRYELREERLAEATGALSEVAERWDRRLRVIKVLAEQAHAAEQAHRAEQAPRP